MSNLLKSLRRRDNLGATGSSIRPGDFPLGSAESRAVARLWLSNLSVHSLYDDDCFLLFVWLGSKLGELAIPDWIAKSREFEHGQSLSNANRGADSKYADMGTAALSYVACYGREPRDGEVWGYADLVRYYAEVFPGHVRGVCEAWERRFSGVACPLKFEDGRLRFYLKVYRRSSGPEERYSVGAEWKGALITRSQWQHGSLYCMTLVWASIALRCGLLPVQTSAYV